MNQSTCLPNTTGSRTKITDQTSSPFWKQCVGGVYVGGSGYAENNDRVEVAVHSPALSNTVDDSLYEQRFYFAINKRKPTGGQQHRVHLYRTGGHSLFGSPTHGSIAEIWVQPDETDWLDSTAQSIFVDSRAVASPGSAPTAAITMIWRSAQSTPLGGYVQIRGRQLLNDLANNITSSQAFDVISPVSPLEQAIGKYTSVSGYQSCASASYPGCFSQNDAWPNQPLLFGWEDPSVTNRRHNDAFAKGAKF